MAALEEKIMEGSVVFRCITCLFFFLFFQSSNAAERDWTVFWDDEHYKQGFKDERGIVRIPPKFMGATQATRFKNIIAVMEELEGNYDSYYLLKSGERVEGVKMFVFDNSFDCESDNKIRYRDTVTGHMGYLDGNGKISVPAVYNFGQPFANGFASVTKGATLTCTGGKPFSLKNQCEHPHWKGGEHLVINASNEVVLEGISLGVEIDRYSLTITKKPLKTSGVESLKGVDGKYYNFINTKKHFYKWFYAEFLGDLSRGSLEDYTFDEVALFNPQAGWYKQPKKQFWNSNYKPVRKSLGLLKNESASFFVTIDNLHQGIYEEEKYHSYYTQCYNLYGNKTPVLSVVADLKHEGSSVQNIFEFLKMEDGYRLISITLRTDRLR